MGCASSKDIDEVERKKNKKGSQSGSQPFDRPGIKYIDENPSNKQPIDDKVTPRDAELEANEESSKGQEVNGVQNVPVAEGTMVAAEASQDHCHAAPALHIEEEGDQTLKVTATTDEGDVEISQELPAKEPAEEEPEKVTVTATTEEGEVDVPQPVANPESESRTEQTVDTSASDTLVEHSTEDTQVPDAINEYATQLADEVQKDSIRQLEREAAEQEQPQALPDPLTPEPLIPEGSSVDPVGDVPPKEGVVQATEAPQEPEEVQLTAPSAAEGADQSQAQVDAAADSQQAPPAPQSGGK